MREDDMQQSRQVNLNWATTNVPSVASILIVGIGVAMYVQSLASKVDDIEKNRQARTVMIDKGFDQMQDQLKPLANLPYRMGVVEQGLLATNQRVDQYLQMLGTKIDGISDRVNGLSTKVEVLSQKIDALTPEKKASFDSTALR
jgi:outer membrane murein-binding lipoprotein Lpp